MWKNFFAHADDNRYLYFHCCKHWLIKCSCHLCYAVCATSCGVLCGYWNRHYQNHNWHWCYFSSYYKEGSWLLFSDYFSGFLASGSADNIDTAGTATDAKKLSAATKELSVSSPVMSAYERFGNKPAAGISSKVIPGSTKKNEHEVRIDVSHQPNDESAAVDGISETGQSLYISDPAGFTELSSLQYVVIYIFSVLCYHWHCICVVSWCVCVCVSYECVCVCVFRETEREML